MKTIVVIGGTGAQGSAIVEHISATNEFKILTLTRNTTSKYAQELTSLPNEAAQRSDYAFMNTDGFNLGEQAETYWGIRLFELSIKAGVKHFIYSGLDYNGRKAGYDPSLYVGHYEGKARVQGDDGVFRLKIPIGQGAVPFIHLGDFARYVPWILSNPKESNGMTLQIATAHVSGPELARAFAAATGHKAEYVDIPAKDWVEAMFNT
ncbi:uncharacterized protein Z518_01883 [Rhinocladiella mackenziei CBS 650.93]|uniref:NmrA-like domain-containing protein n=1 Tax=Rhinocladiella mackenziei CBS 650.93 TaxID=1442369 RepID=A0A0D2JDH4_9EURO|nr:uncharacterized protein Z518_01883 [Rhinocladiella mackenziei CBS 650.93]KIX07230.1 hypothetical protein Z518_01883 [Rhinocladiella mackenziei CBS 650.93]